MAQEVEEEGLKDLSLTESTHSEGLPGGLHFGAPMFLSEAEKIDFVVRLRRGWALV